MSALFKNMNVLKKEENHMNYITLNNGNRSWSPLAGLHRDMDTLFDEFWSVPTINRTLEDTDSQWRPACEVEEAEGHYLISVEMPGVPRDQVKVEFQDGEIVISGERLNETNKKENGRWYSERLFGKFRRSFALPVGIDSDKVEANYQDGILRVYIPKAELTKPRQIKVTNGSGQGFFGKLLGSPKKEQEVNHSSNAIKAEKVA
jgi:HSP20 family protein